MRKIYDMKFYRGSLYLVFTWLLFSCSDQMGRTMRVACGNAVELQRVLNYYEADDPNEMKREAAEFLIENMAGHGSVASPAVDSLACKVRQTEKINTDSVQTWWKTYKRYDTSAKKLDAQTLKADFLIDNIDQAYKVWQTSPWRGEVSKSLFFRYVLPYRLREEPLAEIGWRDSLYQRYHPLIEGVTDLNRAFAIVYKSIHKEFAMRDISFPYSLNVLDAGKMRIGKCVHQCQYIALVMRSLGIPAVVDEVNRWANYSMVGHSWVALVRQDGVYTVSDGDSIARRGNPINSTVFSVKYPLEKDYPIDTNFKKRVVKVWRMNYEQNVNCGFADKMADEKTKSLFAYPFLSDVSACYGLTHSVKVGSLPADYCYLCTYATGEGWKPMAYARKRFGCFEFVNVGDSIVYQPMVYDKNGDLQPVGEAFILTTRGEEFLHPDRQRKQSMKLYRKYPFVKSQLKMWIESKGSCFEGANCSDFADSDTLFKITRTPVYRNVVPLTGEKKYRYVRFVSEEKHRCPLAEMEVYETGRLLHGVPFAIGASHPENCFDGIRNSIPDDLETGYMVGLDLGRPVAVSQIVFFLKNDDNYVSPGDVYNLECYEGGQWKLLSCCRAKGFSLDYSNMPTNALFRLTDVTKGEEVRIFTYENGKQVWW